MPTHHERVSRAAIIDFLTKQRDRADTDRDRRYIDRTIDMLRKLDAESAALESRRKKPRAGK